MPQHGGGGGGGGGDGPKVPRVQDKPATRPRKDQTHIPTRPSPDAPRIKELRAIAAQVCVPTNPATTTTIVKC